jgi:hypothetical protein
MTTHPYITSFIRAVQAAGFTVTRFAGDSADEVTLDLRGRHNTHAFRAWVETRRNGVGVKAQYGYVEQVHDVRTGRERLVDWTSLSTRASFTLEANGAGKELERILNRKEKQS